MNYKIFYFNIHLTLHIILSLVEIPDFLILNYLKLSDIVNVYLGSVWLRLDGGKTGRGEGREYL